MILVEGLLVLTREHEVGVELLVLLKVPLHGRRELGVEHSRHESSSHSTEHLMESLGRG